MRRVQLRGGARRPCARRTSCWGSAGAISGPPQMNDRQPDEIAPGEALRPGAPHSRRWALIVALAREEEACSAGAGDARGEPAVFVARLTEYRGADHALHHRRTRAVCAALAP